MNKLLIGAGVVGAAMVAWFFVNKSIYSERGIPTQPTPVRESGPRVTRLGDREDAIATKIAQSSSVDPTIRGGVTAPSQAQLDKAKKDFGLEG